ncbi:SRPBCC family protein [Methylobacterium aerolatum]|uniref:Uncharacterized protein YndB with AHSA1/START domain n=1 Tax=Methylobacterium aerolatum TaxID=418708 RepID=A0ABU0HWZ6_9HYPH|nr:SRPBCC family protein [Methylobacterium aerolatum]MDQ0446821.1 uncharacterized protein YndB with AHSA1/START domain [Methylobacterium aerolatum]GJD33786.1 hypothetical protein FMGBMHLM_0679 [Methylobacterium aerolatum]
MPQDQIVVETMVPVPVAEAWDAYTSPHRIPHWNFASDDWHCPSASVDLREGGRFSSRMEAKDGSMGFDFAGTYTKVIENERIDYDIGGRSATVMFMPQAEHTRIRVSFDPETSFPIEQQRNGWQAILDNFAKYLGA